MTEAAVVAFLEANPDFFQKQPELLNKLMLPHDVPGATSLVTRQLGVLRERNQALRARLGDVLESAESNHALFEATLKATQALLALSRSVRGAEALAILQSHFAADAIALKTVVSEGAESPVPALPAVSASALENILGPLLSEEPACGALRPEEQTLLFDEARYPSAIFSRFPLGQGALLLAFGSRDGGHFTAAMGTLFFEFLGQTLAALLDPAPAGSPER
ncbi:MAG: DUF484 family protein [Pseudomonadales bacterium]